MSKWHRWTQWNQSKCFGNAVDIIATLNNRMTQITFNANHPMEFIMCYRCAVVVNAKLIVTPDIDETYLEGANSKLLIGQALVSFSTVFVEQLTSQTPSV